MKDEEQSPSNFGKKSAEFGFGVMQFNVQNVQCADEDVAKAKNDKPAIKPDDMNKSEKIPPRKKLDKNDILICDDLPNLQEVFLKR